VRAISVEDVLAYRKARYEASVALVARKGHDYNRQQQHGGDTLFNLRVCELLGIVGTAEAGILTRLSDKLMRLISLTAVEGVTPEVTDEPVNVTIEDVHNYVDYLGLIHQRRLEATRRASSLEAQPPGVAPTRQE
jgi:hypothetical protein